MNTPSRALATRVVAGAIVLAAVVAAPVQATTPCDQNQGVSIGAFANPQTITENSHKYVTVSISKIVGDDDTPPVTVELVSATSSEPDSGLGRGDKPNDIVQLDDYTFLVRAEVGKDSSGRTYSFVYRATDGCGATDEATATVTVVPR